MRRRSQYHILIPREQGASIVSLYHANSFLMIILKSVTRINEIGKRERSLLRNQAAAQAPVRLWLGGGGKATNIETLI